MDAGFKVENSGFNWRWINCNSGQYRVLTIEDSIPGQHEGNNVIPVKPQQLIWSPETGEDCSSYTFNYRWVRRNHGDRFRCVTLE